MRRRANSSASAGSKNTTASPNGMPFFVPPNDITSMPARCAISAGWQPSDATAFAKRAPSSCTFMPRAWAVSHSARISAGVYSVPSSVACVSDSARGRELCSSCGVTARATTASGVTFACGVSTPRSFAPPLKNSVAPHSSTLTCANAWQITASVLRQMADRPSAFAAVPLKTRNTSASASNTRRMASFARSVQASRPYANTCPWFASCSAAIASGQMPALLSLANWIGFKSRDLQPLLDPAVDRLQRHRQRGRIGAAGLRHVRPPASLAPDLLCNMVDEFAGLDASRQVAGDACDQRDLAVGDRGQHDRRAAKLVLQLVHRVAQRLDVRTFDRRCDDLRAFDVDGVAGEVVARRCRGFRLRARELALGGARLGNQLPNARLDLGDGGLEGGRRAVQQRLARLHVRERALAGDRLDAADPGGDTAFVGDLEQPDVAGACDVCAAAQLARAADVKHAHAVAVFLAEQHHGAELLRFLHRHDARIGRMVVEDLRVDQRLDAPDLVVG